MATAEEGFHLTPDGTKLYTKTWKTVGQPRAILVFVHGYSDHCNRYYDLFPTWASYGIEVRAFDQRGWGRTVTKPSDCGRTGPTSVVLSDIHSFLQTLTPLVTQTTPLFLMGNSMGGGEVLYYILHPDSPFNSVTDTDSKRPHLTGVLACSPLVALHPSTGVSALTVIAGRIAGKLLPAFHIHPALDAKFMSRTESVCEDWINDPLCHGTGTLEGVAGMLDRGLWLEGLSLSGPNGKDSVERVKDLLPAIWFGHGSGDRVNSWDATKQLATTLEGVHVDVTFQSYDGAYHKLDADLPEVGEKFRKDVAEWILARCPSESQTSSSPVQPETLRTDNIEESPAEPVGVTDEAKAKL